jgi:V/A-type H+-transporting ATPase subunit E
MANVKEQTPVPSHGIDALIAKLRDEGVSAGRDEGGKIVAEAKAKAKQIVGKATEEAKSHLAASRKEAQAFQSAGEAAIKTAMRDAILDMKSLLMQRFSADVKRLVTHTLKDEELLKRMVLEIAGRARERVETAGADELEVILPEKVIGLDELRHEPDELRKGELTHFVLGLSEAMLREGVTFSVSDEFESGVRVRMVMDDITVELTDEAIAALLLQHLQPRFRAVLEGIVK